MYSSTMNIETFCEGSFRGIKCFGRRVAFTTTVHNSHSFSGQFHTTALRTSLLAISSRRTSDQSVELPLELYLTRESHFTVHAIHKMYVTITKKDFSWIVISCNDMKFHQCHFLLMMYLFCSTYYLLDTINICTVEKIFIHCHHTSYAICKRTLLLCR